ncbi:hypothetical protein ACFW04_013834 [Cataglyphis niger]
MCYVSSSSDIETIIIDEGQHFPLAVPILSDNIYVDDLLFGADDMTRIRQARNKLNSILKRGGFILRKWASNSPCLLEDIDKADHGLATKKLLAKDEQIKILGIGWNPANNIFEFHVSLANSAPDQTHDLVRDSKILRFARVDHSGYDYGENIYATTLANKIRVG